MRITLHPDPYKIAPGVHQAFEYALQNRGAMLRELRSLLIGVPDVPDIHQLFPATLITDNGTSPYSELEIIRDSEE